MPPATEKKCNASVACHTSAIRLATLRTLFLFGNYLYIQKMFYHKDL